METVQKQCDVAIVGSGPGGAAVARKLAAAGKKVIILEWGRDNPPAPEGPFAGPARYFGGFRLMKHGVMQTASEPKLKMVRGLTTGGSTMMYAGVCEEPSAEKFAALGIDLTDEIAAIRKAIAIQPLRDDQLGEKAAMLARAARALDLPWRNCERFFADPAKFRQGSVFMGDRNGFRWDARRWILEAVDKGAVLMNGVFCEETLIEGNRAVGLLARTAEGKTLRIGADAVVLAAGGIGSPRILRASGIPEAGQTLCNDPYTVAFGYVDGASFSGQSEINRQACVTLEEGVAVADACVPGMVYMQMALAQKRWGRLCSGKQALTLLIEIADESSGFLDAEGRVHKRLTDSDLRKLELGKETARRILAQAGAKDVWFSPLSAVHPAGTCRIGNIVDSDLKTRIDGLYVADASVLPESLGAPPVLTILALGGRLAGRLLEQGGRA